MIMVHLFCSDDEIFRLTARIPDDTTTTSRREHTDTISQHSTNSDAPSEPVQVESGQSEREPLHIVSKAYSSM